MGCPSLQRQPACGHGQVLTAARPACCHPLMPAGGSPLQLYVWQTLRADDPLPHTTSGWAWEVRPRNAPPRQ